MIIFLRAGVVGHQIPVQYVAALKQYYGRIWVSLSGLELRNYPVSGGSGSEVKTIMAGIEEHVNDCEALLGHPWKRVHKFLDQYAEVFPVVIFTEYHRGFLHNKYGIEVVRAMWGPEAEKAAIAHIARDYAELPMTSWKRIDRHINRALLYFSYLGNLEPNIQPHIIRGWAGESLVSIAMGEEKE